MRILRFTPFLALVTAPAVQAPNTQACDDATVVSIARWAGIANARLAARDTNRLVVASACKVMPNAPGTTIAAVAFDSLPKSRNPDESRKLQVVALVEGGKVAAAERSVVEEDAVTSVDQNSYRIDTAPYRLSPDVRAFGVVFTSSANVPHCAEAYAENELTLWVREGNRIRPVFGTNLDGWTIVKGSPCGPEIGDTLTESAHMTIAVERTSSHGFADLSITARVDPPRNKDKRQIRTTVRYDGKSYGIDMFRTFWYPPSVVK